MRSSIIEFIKLEHNDSIRDKNKHLSMIESLFLSSFKKYKPINIEYIEQNEDDYTLNLVFCCSTNKYICFEINEDSEEYTFSLPQIYNKQLDSYINTYDFCMQQNEVVIYEKLCETMTISKQRISTRTLSTQIQNHLENLLYFTNIEEVDKILHTDYWAEDIEHDWRLG